MQASAAMAKGPQQQDATQQVERVAQCNTPAVYVLPPDA